MAGLAHLGFIVLAFVKASLLGREATRLRTPIPNEHPGLTVLRTATGFGMVAALIALCLAAYYQQPWYKMKSFEEIAKASKEARGRGVTLSEDEAELVARKNLLTEHGQARGLQYGASLALVVLMGLSWLVGLRVRTSASRAIKLLALVSAVILGVALIESLYLQQPWGSVRKAAESEAVIGATWPNDPMPSQEKIDDVLYWKEFKEKKGCWVLLVGAAAVCLVSVAGGILTSRKIATSQNNLGYSGLIRALRWVVLVASIICTLSLVLRVPGGSGVSRGFTGSEMARHKFETIVEAEIQFHDRDLDGNGIKDWWVGDVSGLNRILRGGEPISLVDEHHVQSDDSPLEDAKGKLRLKPFVREKNIIYTYHLAIIPVAADGTRYAQDDGEGNAVLSTKGFAFCAFPFEYRTYGVDTLIVDQSGIVWRKDIGGARVQRWPEDPEKEGWKKWIDGLRRRREIYVLSEGDE